MFSGYVADNGYFICQEIGHYAMAMFGILYKLHQLRFSDQQLGHSGGLGRLMVTSQFPLSFW